MGELNWRISISSRYPFVLKSPGQHIIRIHRIEAVDSCFKQNLFFFGGGNVKVIGDSIISLAFICLSVRLKIRISCA